LLQGVVVACALQTLWGKIINAARTKLGMPLSKPSSS
jgi:hypothetical protein